MATAKQIAWRKKFAAMAKAGTLKKKAATKRKTNPARKKAPTKRVGVSAKKYISRPSQATGKTPTKRLKARRAVSPRTGAFPNPAARSLYTVHRADANGQPVYHIAHFNKLSDAKEYAKAYANAHKVPVAVTSKSK
jgi:hypothetical protein